MLEPQLLKRLGLKNMKSILILWAHGKRKKISLSVGPFGVKGLAESPERTQSLLDALYIKGVSGDTKSAELYLKATGFLQQAQTVNIKTESSVKDLSDAELQAMIVEITQQKIKNKE
jgi:hypothetical protein